MARVAFIMDRIMRAVGLHGKSFIPLVLGLGCTVPAVMSTRTLDNHRDRLVTILVLSLMSCSARLPVYTVLIAAFFAEKYAGTILFSIYLFGIILAILMARIFRSTLFRGEAEPFVMELPSYQAPVLKNLILNMWERSVIYIKKAGSIILAASILMWFLTSYPAPANYHNETVSITTESTTERLSQSYAERIGHFIEPVLRPLGFDWKIGIGLFAGFAAKEVMVSTLATIYSVGDDETGANLREHLANDPNINPLVAYTLMIFFLVYAPCLPTIVVIWRETNSLKWASFSLVYTTVLAWMLSFLVYQTGSLLKIGV
jgi:ferrous iron transport protein B